jgi:hypothetical protein
MATVSLSQEDNAISSVKTGKAGDFSFGAPSGVYAVRISATGFDQLNFRGQWARLVIDFPRIRHSSDPEYCSNVMPLGNDQQQGISNIPERIEKKIQHECHAAMTSPKSS